MATGQLKVLVQHLRQLAGAQQAAADSVLLHRFHAARDEEAFTALVARHGPLVLSICQQVLQCEQDAEDAFQATFLVLARKAASIRPGASVASWLHGTAYRTALKARVARRRRTARESRTVVPPTPDPVSEAALRELQRMLHEEVSRLPEPYRAAFVLCGLEGRSRAEAAAELGCNENTLSSRLAAARERLRRRLLRRGVALSAALGLCLLTRASAAPLSPALASATATSALRFAAEGTAAACSAPAVALARQLLGGTLGSTLRVSSVLVLALGLLAAGAGPAARSALAGRGAQGPASAPPVARAAAAPEAAPVPEADPLPAGVVARLGTSRFRHGGVIARVAFAPDGRLLASVGREGTIRVWDAATARALHRLAWNQEGLASLVFLPDGRTLAARNRSVLQLWDLATGQPLRQLPLPGNHHLALSRDGRTLVTGDWKGDAVLVCDAATGQVRHRLPAPELLAVALAPDGKGVAALGADHTLRLWDLATGAERWQAPIPFRRREDDSLGLAFSPAGRTLAVAADHLVHLLDGGTGRAVRTLQGHRGGVLSVSFSPDGTLLASAGQDGVRLWDAGTGREIRHLTGHHSWVTSVAFSPDGSRLATGSHDHTLRLWETATGSEGLPLEGHQAPVRAVAVAPGGTLLATGAFDDTVRLRDLRDGRSLQTLPHPGGVLAVALSADGRLLASGGGDGHIHVWDAASGARRHDLPGHPGGVWALAFVGGGTLVSAGEDRLLRVWQADSGKQLRAIRGHAGAVRCLAVSPDGRTLASGGEDQTLRLWDLATGAERRHVEAPGWITALAYAPNGQVLASAGSGGRVCLWDAATGRQLGTCDRSPARQEAEPLVVPKGPEVIVCDAGPGRNRAVQALAFAPDGRTLLTAEQDGAVLVWEVVTCQPRRAFVGHEGAVNAVAFVSPTRAVSAGDDLAVLVWDVAGSATVPPSAGLDALWETLAAPDAAAAHVAIRTLAQAPAQAVPLLAQRLPPITAADVARLPALVADLDSTRFQARQQAAAELERLERLAEPPLRRALADTPSPEVRRQAEQLLERLRGPTPAPAVLRALRAVEALEQANTPAARQLLATLAGGIPNARLTQEAKAALARMVAPLSPR